MTPQDAKRPSAWRTIHCEETESTNILARGGSPGDVFTASYQTAGRGRLDHRWQSERGKNLIMSAVADVGGLEPGHAATLPLAAGLAVAKALGAVLRRTRRAAPEIGLKWPNDILAGGRKICGILCERRGDCAIVGVGVNVRQTEFPPDIADRATSLALLGADVAVEKVRDAVLSSLSGVLAAWRGGFGAVWLEIAAIDALKGRRIAVVQRDGAEPGAEGRCGGIQADGSLLVGGRTVWSGEAHVIPL